MAAATASLTVSARPSSFRGPSARKTFGAKSTRSIRASGQFKVGCLPALFICSRSVVFLASHAEGYQMQHQSMNG